MRREEALVERAPVAKVIYSEGGERRGEPAACAQRLPPEVGEDPP